LNPEDVGTASTSVPPADTQTAASEEGVQTPESAAEETQVEQQEQVEPDYKALYEEERRRRAGLDRKLSRLQRGRKDTDEEELWTGNEEIDSTVLQHPLTRKALGELANLQLKEGVREVLKDFKHVPKEVRKAIRTNPRGFASTAQTVDEAIEEIENFLLENYGVGATGEEQPAGKEFPAASTNASVAESEREKSLDEMSAKELEAALDRGEITLQDLEQEIRRRTKGKEVKKLK